MTSNDVCLDASTAIAFAFVDEKAHTPVKSAVLQFLASCHRFCAPAMFAYEVDSVLRPRVYRGELTLAAMELAQATIESLDIEITFDPTDRDRAMEIARLYDQPRAYDAAYAAHAQARGVELWTTDHPFFEAVNGTKKPKNAAPLEFVKWFGSNDF